MASWMRSIIEGLSWKCSSHTTWRQIPRRDADGCVAWRKSVFECVVNAVELEQVLHRLRKEIDLEHDSLRVYRLHEPRDQYLQVIGRKPEFDIRDPLVL